MNHMDGGFAREEGIWCVDENLSSYIIQSQAAYEHLPYFNEPGSKPAGERHKCMNYTENRYNNYILNVRIPQHCIVRALMSADIHNRVISHTL